MSTKSRLAKEAIRKITGPISFAEVLLSFRLSEELTQVEMAKKLKISKHALCNIEKGRKIVSVERAVKFAELLDRSPTVFAKYVLQDQLLKAGIEGDVEIRVA